MRDFISKANYFYLGFAILWFPFQEAFLKIDAMGRIPVFTALFIFIANFLFDNKSRIITFSKPIIFWGIWVLYSTLNLIFHGYRQDLPLFYFFGLKLFIPFVVLLITYKETLKKPLKVIKYLLYVFLLYAILAVTVFGSNIGMSELYERSTGELGNLGPLTVIYIILFASILYIHKRISIIKLTLLIIFPLLIVIGAETRKAFGAAIIMILMFFLSQFKMKPVQIFLLLLLTFSLYVGSIYVLENTSLGDRFAEGMEVGEVKNTTNIEALSFLGDRAFFYIYASEIFINNLLIGIGLQNFKYITNTDYLIHSEYMVQLAEGGIIGTFFFLVFNIWIGRNLLKAKMVPKFRKSIIILMGGYFSILFINLTAWTYSFPHYFIVFGIIIGFIKLSQHSNSKYYVTK